MGFFIFSAFSRWIHPKGEEASLSFLKRTAEVGQRDAEANDLIIFLADDDGHEVVAQHGDVHTHIVVNLLTRQLRYPVED